MALGGRIVIGFFGVLALVCFCSAALGIDIVAMRLLGVAGLIVLLPISIFMFYVVTQRIVPIRLGHRICGVLFPLLIVSILWTYWPFRLTYLLHKKRLDEIVDQIRAGHSPALPLQVGFFRIYGVQELDGNIGLNIGGPTIGGTDLVREAPTSKRVWHNTNWEVELGDHWHYVYED